MTRRVEVDPARDPIPVPSHVLHELCQHAREAEPEECCGLLVGNSLDRYRRLVRCRNEMTSRHAEDPVVYPRDGRAAYYMNEHDYLEAWRTAEEAGERITAVYHSHVGAGAYLSELDLAYAENRFFPFPRADQIVIPVFVDRTVGELGLFRREGASFVGHAIDRVDS